jgi:glycosyltransferase involved in cell wall biosynthesis
MKVAFIHGPLEYSVCLANALCQYCDLDFFYGGAYARHRGETLLTLLHPSVGKYEISPYRLHDRRNFTAYRHLAERLKGYDLIHMQYSNFWFILNRYICRNVPIVYTIHDVVPHSGLPLVAHLLQSIPMRISIGQAAAFIVHGEKLQAQMAALCRIPKRSIHVIPHGEFSFYRKLRSGAAQPRPAGARRKQLLFFGEIRKNKGLEYLIRAEPLISSGYDDYSICIAGRFMNAPGNNLEYYQGLMRDPDRFEIINRFIENHEVARLFESSDIVVLPYVSASQSGILALAFGFEKPVVATDTGSISEVLEHGRTGLLVPPANERLLAEAVLELLRDEVKCTRFAQNAAEVAKTKLNWEEIGKQTFEVYRTLNIR